MKKLFAVGLFLTLFAGLFAQIPCIVIQWDETRTEYTVVNFNYKPATLPIIGLDPDLEVLVKRTPYDIPEYDPRLKVLVTTQGASDEFDTQYPTTKKWLTTYTLLDRATPDKLNSVLEAENDANYKVFPNNKQLKYIVLSLAIIDRKASGLTISPKQQIILDKLQAKANMIWTNHIAGETKATAVTAGQLVDLDAGWESVDPEQ